MTHRQQKITAEVPRDDIGHRYAGAGSLMCVAEGFRAGLLIFGGAALLYWLLYPASGQELHQHTHDGDVGHFYQTWMRPGHRQHSCCNEKDCYSTSFKLIGGTWFAQRREDGEWMPIPVGILEDNQPDPRDSPDGRGHVCMQPPGKGNVVFCAVLGSAT